MAIGLDWPHSLAVGAVSNSPSTADTLNLFGIADLALPSFFGAYDFPTSPRNGNPNRISQTCLKNNLVFSIDANNGIIVRAIEIPPPIIINPKKLASGAFQFGYSNYNGGGPYTVYASSNLLNWISIGSATQAGTGYFQFTDSASTSSVRFYQVRSP
jgi:hypothetical protein